MLPDPSNYQTIGWLAVIWFGLAGGILTTLRLLDRMKEQPPPSATYIRRDECAAFRNSESKAIETLKDAIQDHISGGEDRSRRVHERIDKLSCEMNQKFIDLPNQIIVLLKNTGAIE